MINPLYPVTVFSARYGGTYEGGRWIAVQHHVGDEKMHGCQSDDLSTAAWFRFRKIYDIPTGRGDTPDEAVADLAQQLGNDWKPGVDSLTARFEQALKEAEAAKEKTE